MMVLKILLYIVCVLLILLLAAVINTLIRGKKTSLFVPEHNEQREQSYAEKLSEMVKYDTVSVVGDPQIEKFRGYHKVLEELFPLVHKTLEKTDIDGNLLYYWKGKNSDRPIVLMGHQDVVAAEGVWEHGYFSGDIADGKIWGRGTADTKCSVMAFLQAIEELIAEGYVPQQDVYLASSCTEEIAGDGGPKIVEELKRRGVKPFLVCDEGGAIVESPIGGIKGSFAMIGVLEKGAGNLCFTAKSNGGHSSYPGKNTPIVRLAKFENEIEKHSPLFCKFENETRAMFETLAPYGPFYLRLLFGNMWLFKGLLLKLMPSISNQAAALLKTTIAFTMQSGSEGLNVLPQEAKVYANMRFIPHQGMNQSIEAVKKVADKYDITTEVISAREYCEPVNINSEAFHMVEKVVEDVFPKLPVCPYVMTGATDARFYSEVCDACIRFSPVLYGPDQMKGMHGLNENLDIVSLPGAVDFYKSLVKYNDQYKN